MANISRYSGCCDWRDTLEIHEYTLEELQNNVKVHIGNSPKPLHIEKMEDLIPFYPYVVSSAGFNNVERTATIFLTSKSYVDIQEEEFFKHRLERLLKIYNRCKRKKVEFDVDAAVKELCWNSWSEEPCRELANRVKEHGKKASIDGIHLNGFDYYRRLLVEEMLKNGLNPADYGYERFVNKEV